MYQNFFKMMRSFIKALMVIVLICTIIPVIVIFSELGKFGGVVIFIGLAIVVSSFISFLCLYFIMKGIAYLGLKAYPEEKQDSHIIYEHPQVPEPDYPEPGDREYDDLLKRFNGEK